MYTRMIRLVSVLTSGLFVGNALAEDSGPSDWVFAVQASVQSKNIEFSQDFESPNFRGDVEVDLPMFSLGGTMGYKKFYVTYKYETEFKREAANSTVPFTGTTSFFDLSTTEVRTELEREDWSVTVGYNVWRGLSVFGGLMAGETVLQPDPQCLTGPGCNPVFSTANLAQTHADRGTRAYYQEYEEDGYFYGASYAFRIADAGSLSLSVAYADLDGSYRDNWLGGFFDVDGESEGLSVSVGWSGSITEHLGYFAEVRSQMYDQDMDGILDVTPSTPADAVFLSIDTEEDMLSYAVGIRYIF